MTTTTAPTTAQTTAPATPTPASTATAGIALAVLRVAIGFLFLAHGWQKFSQFTIPGTTAAFEQMGIPAAGLVAPLMATLEVAGGIALILGLLARVAGAALALAMAGAIATVHAPFGIFVADNGFELVLALAAGSAAIALLGAGRFSLDRVLFAGRAKASFLA
ncbi:hypothetical protein NCCP1664_21200 [Zafaria cholistanensis]|uniref:DoxX family protein n=1 Tax=Zafaria cholistanensis TaxID=1682741 RepID=A0A5A7NS20_9MICC|nr:hypothetical protein NCCP1664_21200 [Zafaria cholistanensis]